MRSPANKNRPKLVGVYQDRGGYHSLPHSRGSKKSGAVLGPTRSHSPSPTLRAPDLLAKKQRPERLPTYFYRLKPADQRRYLASDRVAELPLKAPCAVMPEVAALRTALESENLGAVTRAAQRLVDVLLAALCAPPVSVEVRGVRPRNRGGELHGIFYPRTHPPRIVLWARTARRHEMVAWKTFLRTLAHELVHHLDYALLKLGVSFHTYGFFQRESFLVRVLSVGTDSKMPTA
jgi:hypothetical protein